MLLSACEFVVPYSITFTTQEGSIVNPDSDTLDLAINHEAYAYISRLQCDENDPVELLPVLKEDVSASKAHNLSLNLLADQVDGARCEVTVSAYDQTTTSSSHEEIFVFGLNESLKEARMMSFFKFYHDLRKKNKIKVRLLLNKNIKRTIEKNYKDMIGNESIKYVNIKFPTGVFIFKDHVINIIADDKKITAFDLRSKINSEKYKEFFNDIWSNN